MKRTLTLLAITSLCIGAKAQQPLNGDFENWTSSILYEDTPPFITTAQQSYFMFNGPNIWSVPSPVQGNYAAHLQTFTNGTDTLAGGIYFGIPDASGFLGGGAYSERPDSLVFWANHNLMAGDTGTVVIALEFMNNIIGFAFAGVSGNSGGFIRYAVPFQYNAPVNPDSICFIASSANLFSGAVGTPGSILEIDSVRLIAANGQIPNGNFENWTPYVVTEPDNWATLNFGNIYDGNYSVLQDNSPYMGSYDCLIKTTIAEWGDTIGYISNGNFNGPNGPGGGMQVVQNPQKLTGYYKYTPVGLDTALAGVWSNRWDWVGDSSMVVEEALVKLPATNTWTYFEVNLTYNTFPNIDTLTIAFASSNFDDSSSFIGIGSMLYIDEVGVSYYPLSIGENNAEPVAVFPNPAARFLNVRLELVESGQHTFTIYNAEGKLVKSESFNNTSQAGFFTMEVADLPAGNYVWKIEGGATAQSGSFVKE